MRSPSPRTALITGASGGIGSAATKRLAAAGWTVVAAMREPSRGGDLSDSGRVVPLELDVVSKASVATLATRVRELVGAGGLDGLVNNAGVLVEGPFELLTTSELRRQF